MKEYLTLFLVLLLLFLVTARAQLQSTEAQLAGVGVQRQQYEHAIAVLIGKPPAAFSIEPLPFDPVLPTVPAALPADLLQRRPDVAAQERAIAAANAQIGIQRAAYFPSLGLSASYGGAGSSAASLFRASGNVWSLGLSAAQTLFDAGATRARVEGAEAARDVAVANYRQSVLLAPAAAAAAAARPQASRPWPS